MATIGINSNSLSLMVRRYLDGASDALSRANEKLSSGMRINHASDDAAGLAIATSLNASSRVMTQGLRNVNDGISALSIAEGGVANLNSILTRIQELSEQSSSGTFSSKQRTSLDGEAQALLREFERISATTSFNGVTLLNGVFDHVAIEAGGEGTSEKLFIGIADVSTVFTTTTTSTTVTTGTGVFSGPNLYGPAIGQYDTLSTDLNNDGKVDIVTVEYSSGNRLWSYLGNGDGTFLAPRSVNGIGSSDGITAGDFNKDGKADVAVADFGGTIDIYLGDGAGGFSAGSTFYVGLTPIEVVSQDMNGDGNLDIISADRDSSTVSIIFGNGNGTFTARTSILIGSTPQDVQVADVNNDSKADIITALSGSNVVGISLGNGNGTFKAPTYLGFAGITGVDTGDVNNDGIVDILAANYYSGTPGMGVFLGTGGGSFSAAVTYFVGATPWGIELSDFNGDSKLDAVVSNFGPTYMQVLFGNGDGTFKVRQSYSNGSAATAKTILATDITGDGVADIVGGTINGPLVTYITGSNSTTTTTTTGISISLLTQSSSRNALDEIQTARNILSNRLSNLGSQRSRLQTAIEVLRTQRENYNIAHSRIMDADIAEQTSEMIKSKIKQSTASSILVQVNQSPKLALQLLGK